MNPLRGISVKWNNAFFQVDTSSCVYVGDLKRAVCQVTGLVPNQFILDNLTFNHQPAQDHYELAMLGLPNNFVLIASETTDDADAVSSSSKDVPQKRSQISAAELEEMRVAYERDGFRVLEDGRPNKCLLVLGIDNTIYDNDAPEDRLKYWGPRRYVHQLLARVYPFYDIALWSATDMSTIMRKVDFLGITNSKNFRIAFYADEKAMVVKTLPKFGAIKVKALDTIWAKFPQYNEKNTVICDDQATNLVLNTGNGLLVKPYFYEDHERDDELMKLADHTKWNKCVLTTT